MTRVLLCLLLIPGVALVSWMAFDRAEPRAEFVLTSSEPRTLDPQRTSWLPEIQLASAMFEGLTRLNPRTFEPEAAVARSWTSSPDRLVYTFTLRDDARWSNGDPVRAGDFRFAWLRVLDPRVQSQYASLLFVIAGAEAYYHSRLDEDPANDLGVESVGIEVTDAQKLRVRLGSPCPYFLELTSFITLAPVHPPTLEEWAYRDGAVLRKTHHLWTRPEHIVCNGAFVLARWDFKQRIRLRRNPHYWEAGAIGVDTIEALITSDPNAALIAYETGRADLVRGLERSVAEALLREQQAGLRDDVHLEDRFATFFYRVNCRRPPLDRPAFRRALSLAIDREAICEHVLRLGEAPADTFVPKPLLHVLARRRPDGSVVTYAPPPGLCAGKTDGEQREAALAALAESGFDPAERPIEIAFAPEPEQLRLAAAIQAMWEETLGLRVELRMIEGKVLSRHIRNLDYDLARSNWYGDYLDPSTFLNMFRSGDGQNRTGWSNESYDGLIAAAREEADIEQRYDLFSEAERVLCEVELPIIPVFHRRGHYLLRPTFGGLHDNPRDLLPIHRVRRTK